MLTLRRIGKLLLGLLIASQAYALPPEEWLFLELDAATSNARQQDRPIFLLFGFKECSWCEYLYRRALHDADLRALYAKSVVPAYYDTRKHKDADPVVLPDGSTLTHKQFIERFNAYPTPSWIFLSPNGDLLASERNARTTVREFENQLARVMAAYKAPLQKP